MKTELLRTTNATASSIPAVPRPLLQRKCSCGGSHGVEEECADCRAKRLALQRKPDDRSSGYVPPLVYEVLRSPGRPLDEETRVVMEAHLGHEFSHVRVHADGKAAESARSVGARAYAVGHQVVFGSGQYVPGSVAGRRLLAHELTHVEQQSAGGFREWNPAAQLEIAPADGMGEREAEACSRSLEQSPSEARVEGARLAAPPMLQRQGLPSDPPTKLPDPVQVLIDLFDEDTMKKVTACMPGKEPFPAFCTGTLIEAARKIHELISGGGSFKPDCPEENFELVELGPGIFVCCEKRQRNLKHCCHLRQVNRTLGKCCPPDTVLKHDKCEPKNKPMPVEIICPAGSQATTPNCCIVVNGLCLPTTIIPQTPSTPQTPPTDPVPQPILRTFYIGFEKDRPQPSFVPTSSFAVSVTAQGKKAFQELALTLKKSPELRVRLLGRASSEKPQGDKKYNFRLTERRVQLIENQLGREVGPDRLGDPPQSAAPSGCEALGKGLFSCGDAEASAAPSSGDRQVTAEIFTAAGP